MKAIKPAKSPSPTTNVIVLNRYQTRWDGSRHVPNLIGRTAIGRRGGQRFQGTTSASYRG